MITPPSVALKGRNPDVLTCIANLSNDEVFTPPEFANRMLDTLAEAWAANNNGANIWADSSLRFLDPCTKSGVFLREITSRLTEGLKNEIPDLQERVDHILKNQVFGIGITHLTSLLARRSVYCSKHANGKHSIADNFTDDSGNIWFERMEHSWGETKCEFCGAPQAILDRGDEVENYAYAFIHTDNIKARLAEIFGDDMQFDVIIGNPPYQLASDGGTRDVPIYQQFVEQAKELQPRFLSMVIPSRWMASGLGLSEFRQAMLSDKHIRELVDYPSANEVFPGVEIKAGVCYFLWDSSYVGECGVRTVRGDEVTGPVRRNLGEYDVFVRDARAVTILNKVLAYDEPSVNTILARDKEFGWTSNFDEFHNNERSGDVPLYYIRKMKRSVGYIRRQEITKSSQLIDTWKLLVPKAGSDGGQKLPDIVLGKSLIAPSPSVCTQSFLFFYLKTRKAAESLQSYYTTRFFRFLVSLRKITQDATHSTYAWVPIQSWDRNWTDKDLFSKYNITQKEQEFIETQVRSMNIDNDNDE
ncbi:MAG TPA: Eco57I restriction-modification methylase domain-containing protein [Candidatus Kapabacteria bacterium]|nr:Eco57I restriction-modification methylase domain-containing protein [Candidatus Kapabacteria bacterium]